MCTRMCVCVGRKSVCGGAAFFFPKRRGLVHPQHPVPTSLKMEKRSFARCWEYRLNAKQVPIRGRRKGQQECRNADINSPSGKTWWVIDQCSFCSCSQEESQPLDVAFSCNCLVGGDEEVDTARKQTGSTPWKKVFSWLESWPNWDSTCKCLPSPDPNSIKPSSGLPQANNPLLLSLQNSFSSVFHMEYEELGEVLDIPKR